MSGGGAVCFIGLAVLLRAPLFAAALTHCLSRCPAGVRLDPRVVCLAGHPGRCDTITSGAHPPPAWFLDEIVRKAQHRCIDWVDSAKNWTGMRTCLHERSTKSGKYVAIVVPYRDRQVHLDAFLAHMKNYTLAHLSGHHIKILVVEQDDRSPFNRAWLANVGFTEASKSREWDCVVLHDVDVVPFPGVPYTECGKPVQLGSELEHFNWGVPYHRSAGGVVSMSPAHWRAINGYSNDYVGWGGEDDDLFHRLRLNGLLRPQGVIHRPARGKGKFGVVDQSRRVHTRGPQGTYKRSISILREMENGSDRWKRDGLNSLSYTVTSRRPIDQGMAELIRVRRV